MFYILSSCFSVLFERFPDTSTIIGDEGLAMLATKGNMSHYTSLINQKGLFLAIVGYDRRFENVH